MGPRHRAGGPRGLFALVVTIALLFGAPTWAQPQPPGNVAESVDRFFEPLVELNDFSGVVLIASGDRVLAHRAYGFADLGRKQRHRLDQRFAIASISKQFTAAAVLALEERGALALEDPIERHLPGFEGGDRITLLQLLTHTSGLGDLTAAPSFAAIRHSNVELGRLATIIETEVARSEPGSYSYSNAGFTLLAHVTERVSGRPFASWLEHAVFEPLGMHDTTVRQSPTLLPGQAVPYDPKGNSDLERARPLHPAVSIGAAGVVSTADDLLSWMSALRTGTILSDQSRQKLLRNYGDGYGLGIGVGRTRIGHDGRTAGVSAAADWYPGSDRTVIVLSNVQTGAMDQIRAGLAAIADGRAAAPLRLRGTVDASRVSDHGWLTPARRRQLVGSYRFGPDLVVHISERNGQLRAAANSGFGTALVPMEEGILFNRALYANIGAAQTGDGAVQELSWLTEGQPWKGRRER